MIPDSWQRLSFAEARRSEPPQPDFCLPNLVAGSVGVVAAPAGVGKTSLLIQFGAAVAGGVPVAGGLLPAPDKTGRVVFLATEDPLAVLRRRVHFLVRSLEAQQPGEDIAERLDRNMVFYCAPSQVPILLIKGSPGGRDSLGGRDRLTELAHGTRLLILDPIRRFHYSDEQDYSQMAMVFGLLSDVAAITGCTILFSHHVPQPTSDADLEAPAGALGSDAFVNATRWVVNLSGMSRAEGQRLGIPDNEQQRYVLARFSKSNYGPPIPARWLRRSEAFEGVLEYREFEEPAPERL